jgi:mRNA interferase HigB
VRILGAGTIVAFARKHAAAVGPLTAWRELVEPAQWRHYAELKADFAAASYAGGDVIFNIGGNRFRLTAFVDYRAQQVIVVKIETHAKYSQGGKRK